MGESERNENGSGSSQQAAGRPRSEEAHQAILDATLELLVEVGFSALTVEGVASRAGVGKATIYRRWPSKLPLVVEAFGQLPGFPEVDTGDLAEDLKQMLRGYIQLFHTTPLATVLPSELRFADVVVNFTRFEARKGDKVLEMTRKEFGMLQFLAARPGEVERRDELLDEVWDYRNYPTTRTVDNHIASLRAKIENNAAKPQHLLTVHGVGYKLVI